MNKLPETLPECARQSAALLLVHLKTITGRHVPEYAKALATGKGVPQSGQDRAGVELFTMLSQMRASRQSQFFRDEPRLKAFFDKFIKDNPKHMAVIVYNAACAEAVNKPWDPQLYGRG